MLPPLGRRKGKKQEDGKRSPLQPAHLIFWLQLTATVLFLTTEQKTRTIRF